MASTIMKIVKRVHWSAAIEAAPEKCTQQCFVCKHRNVRPYIVNMSECTQCHHTICELCNQFSSCAGCEAAGAINLGNFCLYIYGIPFKDDYTSNNYEYNQYVECNECSFEFECVEQHIERIECHDF
jgi:hypothetical protein